MRRGNPRDHGRAVERAEVVYKFLQVGRSDHVLLRHCSTTEKKAHKVRREPAVRPHSKWRGGLLE